MSKPSKKFLILAAAVLLIIGLVSGTLISPVAGVFFVLTLGIYAIGFYVFLNSHGIKRQVIAIIAVVVLMVGAYYVGEKRKERDRAYDKKMTRIAEQQIKPMTMEELDEELKQRE